jgi:hypothetical protein
MMPDLVKEHATNNHVACDLKFVEWPRKLLDDHVDHEFNPCGVFVPGPVISTECDAAPPLSRTPPALPSIRDDCFREHY